MFCKMTLGLAIASIACVPAALAQSAPTAPSPVARYQPTIDITKNPGCDIHYSTTTERLAFHRRLAELYFINFQNDRKNGRNYNWITYGCAVPGSTVLLGTLSPLAEPTVIPKGVTAEMAVPLSGEQRGYFATFPDWGTVPGTLAVVPFEGGAFFRMMYGGHGKDDGKYYTIWETNLILINDQGKITHFEMWNDTIGMDATTRKAFGRSILGLDMSAYGKATQEFPKPVSTAPVGGQGPAAPPP